MFKKNYPFYIITLSIIILLIVPILIQDGMFMDGIQYACVSKNLAFGAGKFWYPFLSSTWMKSGSNLFLEHPPLVYGIQSLFFSLFGTNMYPERIYSFITAIITAIIIISLWKLLFKNNEEDISLAWVPVLLWIIIPVCSWSYQNNILENTMSIFTISSVYFSIRAITLNDKKYLFLLLSGISIFLASFSKGVPGLFPLVVIGIYWLVFRKISFWRMLWFTSILLTIPALIYLIILQNHAAHDNLLFYFEERLLFRINEEPTVTSRLYILYRLLSELLPLIIISCIVLFFSKAMKIKVKRVIEHRSLIIFFFLIGMSGSLPLTLTLVQRGFYFLPSLPFYAIGFSLIIAPVLKELIQRININKKKFNFLKIFSISLLAFSIIFSASFAGKKSRDKEMLEDVYIAGRVIPSNEIIGIDPSMFKEWNLQFYLLRYFNISTAPSKSKQYKYFLHEKTNEFPLADHYKNLHLKTKKFDLYRLE
jgi:4-amino-4-deoxy-L-arabinose transferase-like glycosyltransferase